MIVKSVSIRNTLKKAGYPVRIRRLIKVRGVWYAYA